MAILRFIISFLLFSFGMGSALAGTCNASQYGVAYKGSYTSSSKFGYTISSVYANAESNAEHCWLQNLVWFSSPGRNGSTDYIQDFSNPQIKSVYIPEAWTGAGYGYITNARFSENLEILMLAIGYNDYHIDRIISNISPNTKLYVPEEDLTKYPSSYDVRPINKCFIKTFEENITSVSFSIDEEFVVGIGASNIKVYENDNQIYPIDGWYIFKNLLPSTELQVKVVFQDSYACERTFYQTFKTKDFTYDISTQSINQASFDISYSVPEGDASTGELMDYGITVNGKDYSINTPNNIIHINDLLPNTNYTVHPYAIFHSIRYDLSSLNVTTTSTSPKIVLGEKHQTSAKFQLCYNLGDANIKRIFIKDHTYKEDELSLSDFINGMCEYSLQNIYFEGERDIRLYIEAIDSDGNTATEYVTLPFSLEPLSLRINSSSGPTHSHLTGSWKKDDAEISNESIQYNGEIFEGNQLSIFGLDPKSQYEIIYTIQGPVIGTVSYRTYFKTSEINLTQPTIKQTSASTANVFSSCNILDAELQVGFQWRKYDAPESLPNNEGQTCIFDGEIQGVIKNLQSVFYYKVRSYYKSNTNNYYYSEWQTFDPSDFSFVEPTTYAISSICEDNSVELNGYILSGSEDILQQGFEYWKANSNPQSKAITGEKTTILTDGQKFNSIIENLPNGQTYKWRVFAKTSSNVYYSEEQFFTTKGNSSIDNVMVEEIDEPIEFINIQGVISSKPFKGINIVRFKSGRIMKMICK